MRVKRCLRMISRCILYIQMVFIFAVVQAKVISFDIQPGDYPFIGSALHLVCEVENFSKNVAIYRGHTSLKQEATQVTICYQAGCAMSSYTFTVVGTKINITIMPYTNDENEMYWICVQDLNSTGDFVQLKTHYKPGGVILSPETACDLAYRECTYICRTRNCTYPEPSFLWKYTQNNGLKTINMFRNFTEKIIFNEIPCDAHAHVIGETIILPKHTTFTDNETRTIKLRCEISYPTLNNNLLSNLSDKIDFAVAVQKVFLQPGSDRNITLFENRPHNFNCITSGSRPQSTVFWFKFNGQINETLLASSVLNHTTTDGLIVTNSSLSFTSKRSDFGWNLTCRATSGFGNIITAPPIFLNVEYSANILYFREALNGATDNITISEGEDLILHCGIDSNPLGSIEILHKDRRVNTSHTKEITFQLPKATCVDSGQSICKAWNHINVRQPAVKRLQLFVECSPRVAIETNPVVIAKQGHSAILSLRIIAYPYPSPNDISWSRNISGIWETMPNANNFVFTANDLQYNLTIFNVTGHDYGEYRLEIGNGVGSTFSFVFFLQIQGKPESPYDVLVTGISATSATVQWTPGYNGELPQIFYIRFKNTNENVWRTKRIPDPNNGERLSVIINGLQPASDYELFLFASNDEGNSTESTIITFSTPREETKIAGIIGGAIGGVAAIGLLLASVIFLCRRYILHKADATRKDDDQCYENPVISEQNSEKNLVKSAITAKAKVIKEPSQGESHLGLNYVELSFGDRGKKMKGKKKQKEVKRSPGEGIVYDDIQFGVVGEAYPSSEEENNTQK